MLFAASYDRLARNLTALVAVVMAAALAFTAATAGPAVFPLAGLLLVSVGLTWALAPQAYLVRDGTLVVRRLVADVRVPLTTVSDPRPLAADGFVLRLFGSGGLFGWFGWFRIDGRTVLLQATRRDQLLLLERAGGTPIVVSPDDVAGFQAAVVAARGR